MSFAALPVPSTSADEVERIADDVLARSEFADAQATLWQRVMQAIVDFIGRVFETIGGGGRGSVIGLVTLLVLAAVTVYLVARYTRTMRRDPGLDLAMDTAIGRTPRQWLTEAAEHEAAGRWRDAVRCRYRGLLAELAAAGLVDEVAGRTSGEYLAVVRDDVPTAGEDFAAVTRRFEQAWYGHEPTSAEDAAAVTAAARRTVAAAGLRRSPVAAGA